MEGRKAEGKTQGRNHDGGNGIPELMAVTHLGDLSLSLFSGLASTDSPAACSSHGPCVC